MSQLTPNGLELIYVKTCRRSVTTAGTPEPFETGAQDYFAVLSITIRADATNNGNLYVGDSNRVTTTDYSYILAPGESVTLDAGQNSLKQDRYIDLTNIWIEADNDGNSCSFIALVDRRPW